MQFPSCCCFSSSSGIFSYVIFNHPFLLPNPCVKMKSYKLQIHCFDATTLEREYTILTNSIVTACPGSGGIGYGPLAVGPRWLAYSGSPVVVSNSGRVSPQHLTSSGSFPGFPSNGSIVAHYAKESSKQLAAGIVTLGDMGYKKLSRYCSELLPDNTSTQLGNPGWKGNGTVNIHLTDAENVGMVHSFLNFACTVDEPTYACLLHGIYALLQVLTRILVLCFCFFGFVKAFFCTV